MNIHAKSILNNGGIESFTPPHTSNIPYPHSWSSPLRNRRYGFKSQEQEVIETQSSNE